ncbi:unnamed protein product [Oncorhynchus mykiss]|uniref:Endonuclease/exonuclease/phosphatase domain-containing protein n=1 Tax=Oncorhynchus mykiss TaxID=8022 RepID=A0A060VXT0_ONCMY|nr:unnamed protein product [Oncorhynchus mykiss]
MLNPLKYVTFNVKELKADIVFLQETHLTASEHKKLKREWVGQVFASSFNSKARGTAILISRHIPFCVNNTISDPSGRFVLGHCPVGIPLYFAPSIFPSILTSLSVPTAEKHPHSMMLPPPCFTVGMVPGFLQT